jgi:hypothetical protein
LRVPPVASVTEAVEAVALGRANAEQLHLAEALGFASEGRLTPSGEYVEDAYFIRQQAEDAAAHIGAGYRRLPVVQAMIQGFHGRGPVPVTGVMHFLRRHGLASETDDLKALRGVLKTLNELGIISYSNKHQQIRVLVPLVVDDEDAIPSVRVVEPDRPYSNVKHLREILRGCQGYIYWAEPHLDRKVLEPLVEEADSQAVSTIRILSGPANASPKLVKDFTRFAAEMASLGIEAEWRVVPKDRLDWHDRFILTRGRAWNVPPLNTLYKGSYSEAFPSTTRPPFDAWWDDATPLLEWPM